MTFWQRDQLTVTQGLQDFSVTEDRPVAIDVAADLVVGESSPSSATSQLWLLGTSGSADVIDSSGLNGSPTVAGTVISQRITGATLLVGRIYKLVVTHGPANNRRSANVALRIVE